jgi:hypothetical protein
LHRAGTFFKAYAAVEEWIPHIAKWRPCVLEATASLEEYLRDRILRGEVWMLMREDKTASTSPVHAAYLETIPVHQVSPPFEILPVLQRLFNRLDLLLDVPNPTPRRVVLADVVAAPPTLPADLLPPPPPAEDPAERQKLREAIEESKRQFGRPRSSDSAAAGNGRASSPAPPSGNGSTGNGHF